MPLTPSTFRPPPLDERAHAEPFAPPKPSLRSVDCRAAFTDDVSQISTAFAGEAQDNIVELPNHGEVPPEWAGFARVLREGRGGSSVLLGGIGASALKPPPLPANLFRACVSVLPCALAAQHAIWRDAVASSVPLQPDPSIVISRLAGLCRFLGHADPRDVAEFLHLTANSVTDLGRGGLPLTGQALSSLGMGLGRIRATEHSMEVRLAAARLLIAIGGHLGSVAAPDARILAGLVAGLRNQCEPETVGPYLEKLGEMFSSLDNDTRLGSLFIQTALQGLSLLPPCATIETILCSISCHLEPKLALLDRADPRLTPANYFLAAAVVDLAPHLTQEAGRALARDIVLKSDGTMSLPREGFGNPQKTDEWLCTALSVSTAANKGELDLHGMRHSLAAFCVDRVIGHALTSLFGKNRLKIIFGRASHNRANEGVMQAVVDKVIRERRDVHGERISEPDYAVGSLFINVRGRRLSIDKSPVTLDRSGSFSSGSSNSFGVLAEPSAEDESSIEQKSRGSRNSANKKKKQRARHATEVLSARVVDIRVDASGAPQGSTAPTTSGRGNATASKLAGSAGGWLDWLRGWFRA